MAWIIPSAKSIAAKFAGTLETLILYARPDVDPVALSRAVRSARGVFSQIGRAYALELREVHDHQAWFGRQYFIDTAEDEYVLRHASIWGVDPRPATAAIGSVTIEGVAGSALPSGLELSASTGVLFVTTAAVVIGVGGSVTVNVRASAEGASGNLESGIRLATVTPAPEISKVTVASAIVGGADEATTSELQAATQARIRRPPQGGAGYDYQTWISSSFASKAVAVVPEWIGRGSVGVIVIMKNPDGTVRAPSDDERAQMLAHLGAPGSPTGLRPVTAHVVIVAGQLYSLPITVRIRPDTATTRTAVTEAYTRFIATVGDEDDPVNASPIGALIERSRISEAISSASGEYAHDLILPAASVALDRTQYPLPGLVTFEAS